MNALALVRPLAASLYRFQKAKTRAFRDYDVFLSFRGPNSRTSFADFLYKGLVAAGHRVFRDEALPASEQIGPEVLRAIRTCKIVIPVISDRNTKSVCCLGELNEITDCHIEHGKSVFPNGHEGKPVKRVVAKVLSESSSTFIRSVYHYFLEKKRREKRRECQVFLADGPDTRRNFASHLYTRLVAEGIEVFNDDDLIGKDVHEICNAIGHCKISIPILSEHFASSHWCLKHLAQMVECNRTKGQQILPIFYKVEPSHVQNVSHLFREHMLRYKEQERVDKSTYEQWERALREVGSIGGWVSENVANGNEGELVNQVVKEVARLLNIH